MIHTGAKPFPCKYCGVKFRLKQTAQKHEQIHEEKPYSCEKCVKRFHDDDSLQLHYKFHQTLRPYACENCDKKFRQKVNLKRHSLTHTGGKPYACKFCSKKFRQYATLIQHERIHTGERPFSCSFCAKKFRSGSNLRRHEKIHDSEKKHESICTGEKPYISDHCDKKIRNVEDIMKNQTDMGSKNVEDDSKSKDVNKSELKLGLEKSFSCQYCDKVFTTKDRLRRHFLVHTQEKPHSCQYCPKKFGHGHVLKRHIKRFHKSEKIRTSRANALKNHEPIPRLGNDDIAKKVQNKSPKDVDSMEKKIPCKYCSIKFRHWASLQNHERIHTGEKPYQCKHCNQMFRQRTSLNDHERTHTGEKPFSCKFCNSKFGHYATLRNHERIHAGEKPSQTRTLHKDETTLNTSKLAHEYLLSCQYCDKIFKFKSKLKSHLLVHTQEKAYSCRFCPRKFNHGHVLNRHEKKIHKREKTSKFQANTMNKDEQISKTENDKIIAKKVQKRSLKKVYNMEEILEKRINNEKAEYLISWEGYGPEENSWEPESNIYCPVMLKEFEEKYLAK